MNLTCLKSGIWQAELRVSKEVRPVIVRLAGANPLESWTYKNDLRYRAMVYFRIFTIFIAASFMLIVFYGDLATVKSLLAGLCGGFVAVVAAQNSTGTKLSDMEKHLKRLEAKLTEYVR